MKRLIAEAGTTLGIGLFFALITLGLVGMGFQ